MKKKLRHIFLLALVAIFSSLNAQQIKVNAVLDSSKIRIGEQTKLDVYVTYDANAQKNLKSNILFFHRLALYWVV